jgi:hypothetical protein
MPNPKPAIRPMLVTCRKCGFEHIVPPDAIIAGVWMRCCPVCFPKRNADEPEAA